MLDSTDPRPALARASRLRLRLALRWLLVAVLALVPVGTEWKQGMAAPTSRQRSTINTLKRKAARVQDSVMRDDWESAEKELREILDEYGRFWAEAQREPGLIPLLEPLFAELSPSHARLELEGVMLPPLKHPEAAGKSPQDGVSFRNQVAGILVSKCGRCHVSSARGGFRMASYDALLRGSGAGIVLVPRDAEGSRLIEVIESGDMPRGGLRVTEEELATLKAWIAAGAEYDGEDPSVSLTSLTSERETGPERLAVVRATGEETVQFARDLAPVLAERCAGCHGDGRQNAGQLDLSNFEALLRGGENGPVLVPGEPLESLLVRKLRGTAGGARMPRGQPPLEDAVIAQFETWIAERATFDGRDSRAHLADVAALDRATRATHEELRAERDRLARQNWRLGFPSLEPSEARTQTFYLLGTVGERTLADVGRQAEELLPKVAELLKIPRDRPVVRGGLTLFVVSSRYDYSEFGKMVEQRQLPADWRGHWRYTLVDAYAVLLIGGEGDVNEALLAQLVAAVHLAGLGEGTPPWFAEGAARMAVARLAPREPRIVEWDRQVPELLGAMTRPDDFLAGRLGPELTDLASYRFVRFLATRDPRRFQGLLQSLREGQGFEQAFVARYQLPPEELAPLWVQFEVRGARRR